MSAAAGDASARTTLILASGSATRRRLLEAAGLTFQVSPPIVDEAALKNALKADEVAADDAAIALAELKAQTVALRSAPDALVLGADQLLTCAGAWFDKPGSLDEARAQLEALAGQTHDLRTAAVIFKGRERIWHHIEVARLTMRALDAAEIDRYLSATGPDIMHSVGAYQIEGRGIQLMQAIKGDHFTIQGLPLLPLLHFLRHHGLRAP